jgi:hypothetical protein
MTTQRTRTLSCFLVLGVQTFSPERAVYFGLGTRQRAAVSQPRESSDVQKKLNRMLYRKPRDFQPPNSSCTMNEDRRVLPTFKAGISDILSFLMLQKVPQNQYFDRTVRVLSKSGH